jgi:hypothetical protein
MSVKADRSSSTGMICVRQCKVAVTVHAMKVWHGVEEWLHSFLGALWRRKDVREIADVMEIQSG